MAKTMFDNSFFLLYLFIFIIVFFIIIDVIYFMATKFTKTITVKDKYVTSTNKTMIYTVVDSDNKIYNINNVWFLMDFNKGEDFNMITVNSKYNITGYGINIDMLSSYPKIYSITPA